MLKSLKNARRRVVESVLEGVGAAEKTVDEDYDQHVIKFQAMIADMNECGAALDSFLRNQKKFMSDGQDLANSLARIYETNMQMADWPNVNCAMTQTNEAYKNKERWSKINEVIRSSAGTVIYEQALEPFRAAVTKMGPEIDQLCKTRNVALTDFDSYRRRLKDLTAKRDKLEAQGKSGTPASNDVIADVQKFEGKVEAGMETYSSSNSQAKSEIISAKRAHDHLMDSLLITTVVCQLELFSAAAKQLEDVISGFPPEKVAQVRKNVQDMIKLGGVQPADPEEKSKFQKGIAIATGKALPSDFQKTDTKTVSNSGKGTVDPFEQGGNPFGSPEPAGSNPFGSSNDPFAASAPPAEETPPPLPSVAPPAVPTNTAPSATTTTTSAASAATHTVVALYDHDAEEEDELNFKAGDTVEVVETSDNGWWKGRCHGKEGLFPVNYVKTK